MELKAREVSPSIATTSVAASEAQQQQEVVVATTRPIPIKGKRRNLGRQARKRRKKYLEIEAAASAFVATATAATLESDGPAGTIPEQMETACERSNQEDAGTTTILPTDRGYVLEDVRRRTVLSKADRRDLIRQLGFLPGNALRVVARIEDAFSSDDLQKLFAAAAVATEGATPSSNTSNGNSGNNQSTGDTKDTTTAATGCNEKSETNEERIKRMASMIQNMMKEPLVIKLYPLVLRDESSSTKRRRKRRRENSSENHRSTTVTANAGASPTGIGEKKGESAADTIALPQTNPLMEPFPTIYWVTHPLIKALISKLELDRVNVQFEERLVNEEAKENNPAEINGTENTTVIAEDTTRDFSSSFSPLESMKRAHKSYGKERRELLSFKDKDYVKGRRWYGDEPTGAAGSSPLQTQNTTSIPPFSEQCGVAGIRNPKAVKCLHAHTAHYWSGNGDNLVGQWVWERLRSGRSFFRGSIIEDQN